MPEKREFGRSQDIGMLDRRIRASKNTFQGCEHLGFGKIAGVLQNSDGFNQNYFGNPYAVGDIDRLSRLMTLPYCRGVVDQ